LHEFVDNNDLDIRRCILPGLHLNPASYPSELHVLVDAAVTIARPHQDDYIRHRKGGLALVEADGGAVRRFSSDRVGRVGSRRGRWRTTSRGRERGSRGHIE
jgi:hypothetical protein